MRLELLNSEGPILIGESVKTNGITTFYLFFHSKKKNRIEMNMNELVQFIRGDIGIKDSEGKVIAYPEFSDGMKPTISKIEEFINS